MEIGHRIFKRRKALGLTQEELADHAGLSHQFLACVERGEKGLGFDSIIKVSSALGTTTDYLLTGAITPEESDQIHALFELMSDIQRQAAMEIIQNLLIISRDNSPKL